MRLDRLKSLAMEVAKVFEKNRKNGESVIVLVSSKEDSVFLMEGLEYTLAAGILNTMDQHEGFANLILNCAEIFLKIKEDENAVDNLIKKALKGKTH